MVTANQSNVGIEDVWTVPVVGHFELFALGAGRVTLNWALVVDCPPPGLGFVTLMSLLPVVALLAITNWADKEVLETQVTLLTVIPLPSTLTVAPLAKLAPLMVTAIV